MPFWQAWGGLAFGLACYGFATGAGVMFVMVLTR